MDEADSLKDWRPIPGHPFYEVTSDGAVRSIERTVTVRGRWGEATYTYPSKMLSVFKANNGYATVGLNNAGEKTKNHVHQLVMLTFVGPCPDGMQVCHKNGDRMDARLTNLRYDTPSNNCLDKIDHGTLLKGVDHGMAKITEKDVFEIRQRRNQGEKLRVLAKEFMVTETMISRIARKRNWSHV